jgi:CRISPR-associated endoribonuclease Cas6
MRLYLKLSKNRELVRFDYQRFLVGALHKWLGENNEHDALSMYSLSWLSGGKGTNKGLDFPYGAEWFISSYDVNFIKKVINGVRKDAEIAFGMKVTELTVDDTPDFGRTQRFTLASPIFIKRTIEEREKHFTFNDVEADSLMTQTLKHKLDKAGLDSEGISIQFDRNYSKAKTILCTYGKIKNKANYCPIIIEGSPEQIAFAWNVGIGNSTGIGFGSLI